MRSSWVVLTLMILLGCAAHKPVQVSRPAGTETFIGKALFHTGEVNLKESSIVIEPLLPPAFLAIWFDGDLKAEPKEKMLLNCDVYLFEHEGAVYTKLSCPDLGDVFVKTVLFQREH